VQVAEKVEHDLPLRRWGRGRETLRHAWIYEGKACGRKLSPQIRIVLRPHHSYVREAPQKRPLIPTEAHPLYESQPPRPPRIPPPPAQIVLGESVVEVQEDLMTEGGVQRFQVSAQAKGMHINHIYRLGFLEESLGDAALVQHLRLSGPPAKEAPQDIPPQAPTRKVPHPQRSHFAEVFLCEGVFFFPGEYPKGTFPA